MTTSQRDPFTLADFARCKTEGQKIAVLTAYDYTIAKLLDDSGVDCLLVGDSLGTVVQGWDTTLRVTLAQMLYHVEMVARAAQKSFVVADLPFLSYQLSPTQALKSAGKFLKQTQCHAVKLEGGETAAPAIQRIVSAGIPVMGHVGLTPQSVRALGGYKVQRDETRIMADAKAVADAGAFSIVLECVPASLASKISKELKIPTIGIGAGPDCDGQVLVGSDMLGLFEGFKPKFVRHYANLAETIREATAGYLADVRSGKFPEAAESFR
jgi:3-methyl-2-oxobutanoate hydroxymethyltransferase